MKTLKKLFALALVLVMIMGMAVSASAATVDGPTTADIVINKSAAGYAYNAYQIFDGKLAIDDKGTPSDTSDDIKVLSNVEWGDGITDGDLFVDALHAHPTFAALIPDGSDAVKVAEVLSDPANQTSTFAVDFANVAGNYLKAAGAIPAVYDDVNEVYVVADAPVGYYLIEDATDYSDKPDKVVSALMLQVVGDVAVTPKDGEITSEKMIKDGETVGTAFDYSIGDTITFELYGGNAAGTAHSLPDNYGSFVSYYYAFKDIMCEALTFVPGSVVVEYENDGSIHTVDPANYTVTLTEDCELAGCSSVITGKHHHLSIEIEDLKKLPHAAAISADTQFFASYQAVLNDKAVIGNPGNLNEMHIEFTNSPDGSEIGKTADTHVTVFTFELDGTKVDGKDAAANMAGVQFQLYREHASGKEYAKVKLVGANYIVQGWTLDKDDADTIITTLDGGLFPITGLEASVYWLTEKQPLPGYSSIPDTKLTIKATIDGALQEVTKIELKKNEGEFVDYTDAGADPKNDDVPVTIENNAGAQLPSTGGIGTTIFYVLGGVLAVAAVVLLITKKRMAVEE